MGSTLYVQMFKTMITQRTVNCTHYVQYTAYSEVHHKKNPVEENQLEGLYTALPTSAVHCTVKVHHTKHIELKISNNSTHFSKQYRRSLDIVTKTSYPLPNITKYSGIR